MKCVIDPARPWVMQMGCHAFHRTRSMQLKLYSLLSNSSPLNTVFLPSHTSADTVHTSDTLIFLAMVLLPIFFCLGWFCNLRVSPSLTPLVVVFEDLPGWCWSHVFCNCADAIFQGGPDIPAVTASEPIRDSLILCGANQRHEIDE